MLKTSITLFALFVSMFGLSQDQKKIDSLLTNIKSNKNDSLKCYNYMVISDEYWSDNPIMCKEYAIKAFRIAKKIKSHNLLASAYRNLGSASIFLGKIEDAIKYDILSLDEAKLTGNITKVLKAKVNFGNDLTAVGQYDSSNAVLNSALADAEKADKIEILAQLYLNIGNNLFSLGFFDSCIKSYQASLMNSLKAKDTPLIIKSYANVAAVKIEKVLLTH